MLYALKMKHPNVLLYFCVTERIIFIIDSFHSVFLVGYQAITVGNAVTAIDKV